MPPRKRRLPKRNAALPLARRRRGDRAAGTDAECDQRRRACAELDRPPGVHAGAGRRRIVRGGDADAAEVYHALRGLLHERGLATGVGDEGGFAPDLPSSEAAIQAILEAADRAGHSTACCARSRPGRQRPLPGRSVHLTGEGRELDTDGMIAMYEDLADGTRSCSSRTGWPRTSGRLAGLDRSSRWPTRDRRRRHLRHQRRPDPAWDRRGRRKLGADQAQPDRHADGDARRDPSSRTVTGTAPSSPIAPARQPTPRSPTSRSR